MAQADRVTVSTESAEMERLRARIDELAQQLLGARDAALGAEAELGVARARIAELEHQVHVRAEEIDELRSVIEAAKAPPDGGPGPVDLQARVTRRVRRLTGAIGS